MQQNNKKDTIWIFKVLILTLFLSLLFSLVSELVNDIVVKNGLVGIAFIIIIVLIAISIGFDIIATATVTCNIQTFHAMASRKIKGAKIAVYFAKNQSRVTSICSDVIGDICGILSGAAGSSIIVGLSLQGNDILIYSIILSAIIAAATVTCKAIAKIYAIKNADKVVMQVAKILAVFTKNKSKGSDNHN